MVFKDKLFLANCDSVRTLGREALSRRIRIGLVFADGILLSPNALIDNEHMYDVFNDKHIIRYLKEDGLRKVVVRGNLISSNQSLIEYYEKLPDNFIVSSIHGSPLKSELDRYDVGRVKSRIKKMDALLRDVYAPREPIQLTENSLSSVLVNRIDGIDYLADDKVNYLREGFANVGSRSAAYHLINESQPKIIADKLKVEVVDPSYNSLFIKSGEAFVQDRIELFDVIPNRLLQAGVAIKSLRKEIELARYIFDLIVFIKTFGVEELTRFLTNRAIDFAEEKLRDIGLETLARKNWFGLYPILANKMGVEFK